MRAPVAAILALALAAAGCGGGEEFHPVAEPVADALANDDYATDEVETVSAFDSDSPVALVIEGGPIPDGQIVTVEFPTDEEGAQKLAKQYEKVDGVAVVDGTKVFSAINNVDEEILNAVVEAARE